MHRRTLLWLPPVAAVAGCARIPLAGPVVPVAPASGGSSDQGIGISPQPPARDASPELILAGFLAAMASDVPGYPVARQYLTQSASDDWKPESGAIIYDSDNHKPITTADSAAINAPWLGSLDDRGHHTTAVGDFKHNFRMIKVDDQWRIGDPPPGLLLARYSFERYYRPITLYFLPGGQRTSLVTELVHLPEAQVSPTAALEALVAGPSAWLRPSVGTAIPSDARSSVAAVTVAGGIAEVSMTDEISTLADRQRRQLAAQLMWTLNQFSQVTGAKITVNGQPWALPWDAGGQMTLADVSDYAPLDASTWGNLYVISDGALAHVDERGSGQLQPMTAAWGKAGWGDTAGALAVSRDEQLAAVVSADAIRLWVGETGTGSPRTVFSGSRLRRPQVSVDGSTWTVTAPVTGPAEFVRVPRNGTAQVVGWTSPPQGTPVAFRLSSDMTRMAVIINVGTRDVIGLVRVQYSGGSASIEGWQVIAIHGPSGELVRLRDVAWSQIDEMLVVGASTADPRHAVFRVEADGSRVEAVGPSEPSLEVTQVSAFPRDSGTTAVVLTKAGAIWRFEDSFRWQQILTGHPVATLPG